MNFDGIPEETDAERAWRQARSAEIPPKPDAAEVQTDPDPAAPDLGRFIDQLVLWGGHSRASAERAIKDSLK